MLGVGIVETLSANEDADVIVEAAGNPVDYLAGLKSAACFKLLVGHFLNNEISTKSEGYQSSTYEEVDSDGCCQPEEFKYSGHSFKFKGTN